VDILQDNVDACRERMFEIWDKEYKAVCKKEVNEDCREAVRFILSRNIVCGNALSLKKVDTSGVAVGVTVQHNKFGSGKVIELDDGLITIAFEQGQMRFEFPSAFENGFLKV